jgi:flagellar FliL protein
LSYDPADKKKENDAPPDNGEGEDAAPEDEEASSDDGEDGEDGEDGDAPKKGGKKKLIMIAAAVVVLLGGGGGAAYFLGMFDAMMGKHVPTKVAVIELGAAVRYELPMIKADLKTEKCRSALVRTVIVVEIDPEHLPRLENMQLRAMERISTYFRDLERQELVGRKGSDKFRFDATRILNNLIAPARIHSLIFKEFIVQ